MKPLIIIPDSNQKTITMTIEDFKKTITEVWEDGYKEGMTKNNSLTMPYSPNYPFISTTEITCGSNEATTVTTNVDKKRTFDKGADIKTNIW